MQYGFKRWLIEMHELYEDWCAKKESTGAKMQCDMIKYTFKWFSWTGTGPRCNSK